MGGLQVVDSRKVAGACSAARRGRTASSIMHIVRTSTTFAPSTSTLASPRINDVWRIFFALTLARILSRHTSAMVTTARRHSVPCPYTAYTTRLGRSGMVKFLVATPMMYSAATFRKAAGATRAPQLFSSAAVFGREHRLSDGQPRTRFLVSILHLFLHKLTDTIRGGQLYSPIRP